MLSRKIDFAIVISAQNCNPNGDPLNRNRPRQDIDGYGEMSDVCIKHKIRQRLADMGEEILVLNSDSCAISSIRERVDAYPELSELLRAKKPDPDKFLHDSCRKWLDVRSFGQVFAYSGASKKLGVSNNVRGPVSLGIARTIEPVNVRELQMVKSVNLNTDPDSPYVKDSGSMGTRYLIDKGVYVSYGSIFPQLSSKTGFSDFDAEKIRDAISTMIEGDASVARPSGSMAVTLYWWTHDSVVPKVSSARVHRSLGINPSSDWPYFRCDPEALEGVSLEIVEG